MINAFDIDGVLANFDDIFIPAAKEVLGIDLVEKNESAWEFSERFGISFEDVVKVFNSEELLLNMMTVKPIARGKRILEAYDFAGIDYCFITSRAHSSTIDTAFESTIEATKFWVKNVLGSNKPIYFTKAKNKHMLAKLLGVYLMFEDKKETVENLADSEIYVFMPLDKHNTEVKDSKYIIVVEDW